jgi:GR25 family glycosyltransferase involved in LPS biosynthesis
MAAMEQSIPVAGTADSSVLPWDGYFINLDRATERRERMQSQFRQFALPNYRRWPAVDGKKLSRNSPCSPGELGIYRSHLSVLEKVAEGARPAHVLEDDVILCDLTGPAIEMSVRLNILARFDILFLETYVGTVFGNVSRFDRAFKEATRSGPIHSPSQLQIIDLGNNYLYGATSYVVSPRGAKKLAGILGALWQRGPAMPVDDTLQRIAALGRLSIGCVFPFVTTIDMETAWESSAGRNAESDAAMLQRLIRYMSFVRRDIRGYAIPMLERVLKRMPEQRDPEAIAFYSRIIRYYLTTPSKAVR